MKMARKSEEMDHQDTDPETITIPDSPPPAPSSVVSDVGSTSSSVQILEEGKQDAGTSRSPPDSGSSATVVSGTSSSDKPGSVVEHGCDPPEPGSGSDSTEYYDCESGGSIPPNMDNQIVQEVMKLMDRDLDSGPDTPVQNQKQDGKRKKKTKRASVKKGGNDNQTNTENSVSFKNNDAIITPSAVLQYTLDSNQPYDTVISCADGKIGVHRLVIASASPWIGTLFTAFSHRLGELAYLILPDIRLPIIKILLNFCYTGAMVFSKEEEDEVMGAMVTLQLGAYGDLTLREVIAREQPLDEPEPSTSSGLNQDVDQQSSFVSFPDLHLDAMAGPSSGFTSTPRRKKVVEILSSSSGSDDDDDDDDDSDDNKASSDSENDEDADPTFKVGPSRSRSRNVDADDGDSEEKDKRVNLPSAFLKSSSNGKEDEDEATYEYLITSKTDSKGKHSRLFQCYHCVGVFKSLENMSTHMENNHGISLESREADKKDLKQILKCERCSQHHKQVSQTAACLSKRHKTRCYLCLESVKLTEFESHLKKNHVVRQKKGMCVVKCRWCDAGIVLESPFDNKAISSHCYSQHFPSGDCNLTDDTLSGNEERKTSSSKSSTTAVQEKSETRIDDKSGQTDEEKSRRISSSSTDSLFSPLAKNLPKQQQSSLKLGGAFATSTPKSSGSTSKVAPKKKVKDTPQSLQSKSKSGDSSQSSKAVPAVLALLQKASAKRKRDLEETEENTPPNQTNDGDSEDNNDRKKRARLDTEKPEQPQTAKRTGAPVAPQQKLFPEKFRTGVPSFASDINQPKQKRKNMKSVDFDPKACPSVFVKIGYSKTLIADCMRRVDEENESEDSEEVMEVPSVSSKSKAADCISSSKKSSDNVSATKTTYVTRVSSSKVTSDNVPSTRSKTTSDATTVSSSTVTTDSVATNTSANKVTSDTASSSKATSDNISSSKVTSGIASSSNASSSSVSTKTPKKRRSVAPENEEEAKGLRRSRRVSEKSNSNTTPKKAN